MWWTANNMDEWYNLTYIGQIGVKKCVLWHFIVWIGVVFLQLSAWNISKIHATYYNLGTTTVYNVHVFVNTIKTWTVYIFW